MGRERVPQRRADRPNYWFTWVVRDGRRTRYYLGDNERDARRALKILEGAEAEASHIRRRPSSYRAGSVVTLDVLSDTYLDWVARHRKPRTLEYQLNVLRQFVAWAGRSTDCTTILPLHLDEWISDNAERWSGTTSGQYLSVIQSMYVRAIKLGIINYNPVQYVDKPANDTVKFAMTRKQEARCVEALECEEGYFREAFLAMLQTGARPQEVRAVEARHIEHIGDSNRSCWLWHWKAGEAPKGRHARTIWTRQHTEILTRERARTAGHLFRMKAGRPWTANALRLRFMRFREKVKIPHLVANTPRHTYCTRLQQAKVDPSYIQVLMGWQSLDMLPTYGHLDQFRADVAAEFKRIDW